MSISRRHISWLYPILVFSICGICFLSFSRLLLVWWKWDRVQASDGLWYVLLQGLRFDVVFIAQLIALPVVLVPFMCLHRTGLRWARRGMLIYFTILAGFLVYMESVTPNFIGQFDFRPSRLFLEYLIYPKEVFTMLIKAVPAQLAAVIIVTAVSAWQFARLLKRCAKSVQPSVFWSAPLLALCGLVVCVLAARSTLGHRPVNPSTVAFSSDPLVNSLPLSSSYTVAYAAYEKFRYESHLPTYGSLPYPVVLQEVYKAMGMSASQFPDATLPTLHVQHSSSPDIENPKNLVIILLESHGADFVSSLGGEDFSPNLDKLALESMWFDNLYATGTRSVRGIEAVISGFLPTPLSSVVKLGKSQNNFFTVANVLKQSDYKTSFIYGGEAHFDNMKRFFSNNGFQTIVEEKDFTNPTYVGSWGVSDEDLFAKADHVFSQHAASGERFFSLVFTSSNHAPFDFPDGRVTVPGDQHNVGTAVRYADYALGQFIAQAKKSNYWDNTVFLIVADHSDRVFGDKLVPINKFHIPALILGKAIQPRRITKLASQIDLLPTLLSLTGVSVAHPAVGIDFTRKDLNTITGKAIMQYGKTLAFMEEAGMEESEQENQKRNRVIIFRSEQAPLQFEYYDKTLIPKTLNATLKQRALAYTLLPIHLYGDRTYRLPNTKTDQIAVMQKPDANTANPYVN